MKVTPKEGAPAFGVLELAPALAFPQAHCEMKRLDNKPPLVCIYAASSKTCHPEFHDAARRLGMFLAGQQMDIIYGGGRVGLMGALADGALSRGGRVTGVLPRFMNDLEWGHTGLTQLHLVEDVRTRKHRLLSDSDAVVALPGGCGTLEELLEAITLKRLGIYLKPIVLVNTRRFFDPLLHLLASAIEEKFMDQRHHAMWQVVSQPEEVAEAIATAQTWHPEARNFATQ
jgi:uncharacterized protein (TIGR00730 family)